ncbi:hypothetical protein Ddye_024756 [Dipteronia dyeriana]|uniref:Uncharacterized protein n=1 Tax=Dipteronia dyeriana TaxID=168575 RepID=A0AAD9WUH6_9ROSI|nr:hypothetical protein Ddye_024756 [Dipteronia dyeriana]
MKVTLLVLFVGFLLISTSLHVEAKRLISEEKQKLMMMERSRLLSERNNMEPKTKTSSTPESDGDDDDEPNESYGKYGNSNGSDSTSHHFYPNDKKPHN